MTGRLAVMCLVSALATPGQAMDVRSLVTGERDGAYFVEFEAVLDAPAPAVMAVLTDYARYPSLDGRVIEARIVGEEDGRPLLFTRLHGCLGSWFCRGMDRFERITGRDDVLIAESVPRRGDLRRGRAETHVTALGTGTGVRYRNEFEPSFWMPRWLVRAAMLETLESATRAMFANVEARARRGDHP